MQEVAARVEAFFLYQLALVDGGLYRTDHQAGAVFGHQAVPEFDGLGEVVPRVDVQERKRNPGRIKGLAGQVGHEDAVFTAAEEQHGILKLRRHFAQDKDGLGL